MKAALVGTGRMGQAIAWAMDKLSSLGHYCDLEELVLVDSAMENLRACAKAVSCSTTSVQSGNREYDYLFLEDNDIVISALPYHQNEKLARYCIDHRLPYCDLGGHVSTSNTINEYANKIGSVVMTDLGLAPGWINVLAEEGYRRTRSGRDPPTTVEMMVGGLPIKPNNYLKYSCTWSQDGLINEYKDQCAVLINGFNTLSAGMSGLVNIDTTIGPMEAFYTSGGASHTINSMQKRGVQNCHYKTIRYQGHCEALKFLIHECKLTDAELSSLLQRSCPPADDLVIIKSRVDDWEEEKIIRCNKKFSAMQMATAFPISVIANMIGNQGAEQFGSGPLSYEDISYSYSEFERNLDFLFEEADNE